MFVHGRALGKISLLGVLTSNTRRINKVLTSRRGAAPAFWAHFGIVFFEGGGGHQKFQGVLPLILFRGAQGPGSWSARLRNGNYRFNSEPQFYCFTLYYGMRIERVQRASQQSESLNCRSHYVSPSFSVCQLSRRNFSWSSHYSKKFIRVFSSWRGCNDWQFWACWLGE